MNKNILLLNNLIAVDSPLSFDFATDVEQNLSAINHQVTTLVSNMAYYGFIPSIEVIKALNLLSEDDLVSFWQDIEATFKEITFVDKNMDDFVVYKNFPQEVLAMNEAQYWNQQLLMYFGVANENFTEEVKQRAHSMEEKKLKVLQLAKIDSLNTIYGNLLKNTTRWSDVQEAHVKYLALDFNVAKLSVNDFGFKENALKLMAHVYENNHEAVLDITDATDVLRFASAISGGDISLRQQVKFKKFNRPTRKYILSLLENAKNLEADLALRKNVWKKLLSFLHPGDYKFTKVQKAYDLLFNSQIKSFSAQIDKKVEQKDETIFKQLVSRSGDFIRRFHKLYEVFGLQALEAFKQVSPELTNQQLLKFEKYLKTINQRKNLIYPPKGNWTLAQFVENKKAKLSNEHVDELLKEIHLQLSNRLNQKLPLGVKLDEKTQLIKLQTNDQKLANYGRGTVFEIPENMTFIRSASYWANDPTMGNTWFDNGWNFFDSEWKALGACCWNAHSYGDGAIFSGDPTNSKDLEGKACQMIDLYLDKLQAQGVRYAVWNILAYSHICFDNAKEVLATLQWGENAEEGSLYEPSRAQMAFPITGQGYTKYIAYIDIQERKLIYIDANLSGTVSSAAHNTDKLAERMPAFVEYLDTLPSIYDLFSHVNEGIIPILYTDENETINSGIEAYVFKCNNQENQFEQISLPQLLEGK
jgi:hypothetical protein